MRVNRLFLFGIILATVVYAACRKVDMPSSKKVVETLEQKQAKFFGTHLSSNPHIQALTGFMKRQDLKYNFVDKTVNQIGYPRWDKSLIASGTSRSSGGRGATGDSSNIVFIPFVRDSQNVVNAALLITTTPSDTAFRYLCDWQYYDSSATGLSGKELSLLLMQLDKNIFGERLYKITDSAAFGGVGPATKYVRINSTSATIGQKNEYGRTSDYYVWVTTETCYSGYQLIPLNEGQVVGCPPGPDCPFYTFETNCEFNSYLVLIVTGGGTGGGSGGSSGGGGTGGGGSGNPPNCQPTAVRGANANPNCDPGWQPVPTPPPPPVPEPIDTLLKKLSIFINNYSDSIYNLSLNQRAEYSFTIVDSNNDVFDTMHVHTNGAGIAVVPNYNVYGGRRLRAVWHSHTGDSTSAITDTTVRSGPSGDDVGNLFDLLYKQPPVPVFTECGNVRYALIVTDPSKANNWFRTPGNGPLLLYNKLLQMVYSDPQVFTNQFHELTVQKLHLLIGSSANSGIALYKSSNADKTTYSQLNP